MPRRSACVVSEVECLETSGDMGSRSGRLVKNYLHVQLSTSFMFSGPSQARAAGRDRERRARCGLPLRVHVPPMPSSFLLRFAVREHSQPDRLAYGKGTRKFV